MLTDTKENRRGGEVNLTSGVKEKNGTFSRKYQAKTRGVICIKSKHSQTVFS